MITHCLFCGHEFPKNETVEQFPIGTRIAFDPARGRLWSVCAGCRRWTLAPIESRWEALEELERIATDRAQLLVQGENIALLRTGNVDLVRVGNAGLREEAWWRYGTELARRHAHARGIVRRNRFLELTVSLLLLGFPIWGGAAAELRWLDGARRKRYGRVVWNGETSCTRCGGAIPSLAFGDYNDVRVAGDAGLELRIPCPRCLRSGHGSVTGAEATTTLRRLLAYRNFAGATAGEVDDATALIKRVGSAEGLVETIRHRDIRLDALDKVGALGLEIAVNDEVEWQQLTTEVRAVEREWHEAEQVAAIADGELTPIPTPLVRPSPPKPPRP